MSPAIRSCTTAGGLHPRTRAHAHPRRHSSVGDASLSGDGARQGCGTCCADWHVAPPPPAKWPRPTGPWVHPLVGGDGTQTCGPVPGPPSHPLALRRERWLPRGTAMCTLTRTAQQSPRAVPSDATPKAPRLKAARHSAARLRPASAEAKVGDQRVERVQCPPCREATPQKRPETRSTTSNPASKLGGFSAFALQFSLEARFSLMWSGGWVRRVRPGPQINRLDGGREAGGEGGLDAWLCLCLQLAPPIGLSPTGAGWEGGGGALLRPTRTVEYVPGATGNTMGNNARGRRAPPMGDM